MCVPVGFVDYWSSMCFFWGGGATASFGFRFHFEGHRFPSLCRWFETPAQRVLSICSTLFGSKPFTGPKTYAAWPELGCTARTLTRNSKKGLAQKGLPLKMIGSCFVGFCWEGLSQTVSHVNLQGSMCLCPVEPVGAGSPGV